MRALLITTLAVLLLTPTAADAGERKVVAERAGCSISVGDRDADGNDLIIADCVWEIPAEKVIKAVKAPEKHDEYMASVEESTKLADGRVLQVHFASGISNRQITLDFTDKDLPDGGFKTSWTGSAKQEPLRDGLVACPLSDGHWEVHPDGANSKVQYSLRYDAGGSVPTWLVRNFQKGGIADLVEEMKAVAAKM
jgi:hypothetical protein